MDRLSVPKLCGAWITVFSLASAPYVSAQSPRAPALGAFVNVNAGLAQPMRARATSIAVDTDGFNRDEVRTSSTLGRSPLFDVGGGVVVRDRVTIGAAFERSADAKPADVTLSLSHPAFHPTLNAAKATESLERTENAVHLQVGYRMPIRGPLSVTVFGGPSYFTTRQQAVSNVSWTEAFSPPTRTYSAAVNSMDTDEIRASAWGYNVGADASYFVSKHVGVGGVVRYGRATFDLENPLQSIVDGRTMTDKVDGGGVRVGAGVRLRF